MLGHFPEACGRVWNSRQQPPWADTGGFSFPGGTSFVGVWFEPHLLATGRAPHLQGLHAGLDDRREDGLVLVGVREHLRDLVQ